MTQILHKFSELILEREAKPPDVSKQNVLVGRKSLSP